MLGLLCGVVPSAPRKQGTESETFSKCVIGGTKRPAYPHISCRARMEQIEDGHIVIAGVDSHHGASKNKFAFDYMYGPSATQEEVSAAVSCVRVWVQH